MTQHTHREHVDGCFRCELSRDEVEHQEQEPEDDLLAALLASLKP